MYKVMLIDDEKAIRNILSKTIPWASHNMVVAGEAASGIEAINIMDEIRPDIAFVDIHMPFMDGIAFAKLAIARYPLLKIVILTAHDEFSYAKECIGIGVFEYVLKPVVKQEIVGVLERIRKKLESEEPRNIPDYSEDRNHLGEESKSVKPDEIVAYLDKNYADSGLNLTYVAGEFGFNSSYLSRKFKEKANMSFVEYLTKVRMEKACQLAKEGELMYITAERVGIPDPNYFGKCFKKFKGMSYSEYMNG
ncbi:MAG: response regulator [Lachnospiraceae bacterium]|nr:response regulator [Lachnospiraceae bacterium]